MRDPDGKKIVLIAFNGKAMKRDVKIISQRSGGVLVQGLNGGEDRDHNRAADFERWRQNQDQGTVIMSTATANNVATATKVVQAATSARFSSAMPFK